MKPIVRTALTILTALVICGVAGAQTSNQDPEAHVPGGEPYGGTGEFPDPWPTLVEVFTSVPVVYNQDNGPFIVNERVFRHNPSGGFGINFSEQDDFVPSTTSGTPRVEITNTSTAGETKVVFFNGSIEVRSQVLSPQEKITQNFGGWNYLRIYTYISSR